MTWNGRSSGNVVPSTVTCALLHRLEQRGLRLGRRPVDLVGQDEPGEQRPVPERELAGTLVPHERAGDVGRQQVGRELDAAERQAERLRERAGGEGLAEARVVLDEHVPAGEHRGEDEFERPTLADDRALDLARAPRRHSRIASPSGVVRSVGLQRLQPGHPLRQLPPRRRGRRRGTDHLPQAVSQQFAGLLRLRP